MSFFESQFPPNYLLNGFTWNPMFHTTSVQFGAGTQQRNRDWSKALGQGHADLFCDEATKESILAFFLNVSGGFDGFRAKIWADYIGTNQLLGVSDGATTIFQMTKAYVYGARSYTRNIYKPVSGSVTMVEGTSLGSAVSFASFTVDTTTGLITLTAQPTVGHSMWITYQFDTPVIMMDDLAIAVSSMQGTLIKYNVKFDFMEVRETT